MDRTTLAILLMLVKPAVPYTEVVPDRSYFAGYDASPIPDMWRQYAGVNMRDNIQLVCIS